MDIKELIKHLKAKAKEARAEADVTYSDFEGGMCIGEALAYELAAKWMREALSLPPQPDPEDPEDTGLEPEEIEAES